MVCKTKINCKKVEARLAHKDKCTRLGKLEKETEKKNGGVLEDYLNLVSKFGGWD